VSDRQLTYEDVREIIKLVEEADKFVEFRLRYQGFEIELSKTGRPMSAAAAPSAPAPTAAPVVVPEAAPVPAPAPAAETPAQNAKKQWPEHYVVVRAPMVGTFYCAPEPGAKPFVSVGQSIGAQETVCIIEVMKLMNALSADSAGTVREILVADGDTVEYGQPLVVIEPAK
jgi:acetyl-CoA carboxylase biotin carboxyl carrier protein